jgi:hypothetical protein
MKEKASKMLENAVSDDFFFFGWKTRASEFHI